MPDQDGAATSGPAGRFFASARRLLATMLAIGHTRIELLSVELQLELQRALQLFVWAAVAVLAGGIGLLLAGVTVIIAFWDTHRLLAAVLVTMAFLGLALGAIAVAAHKLRTRPPPLEGTLAELARDQERLGGGP